MTPPSSTLPKGAHDHLSLYYDALLDSVADGVLSISPDHRVEVLNATGAQILGVKIEDIVGMTLAEAFLHDEANDAFVDAVLSAANDETGTVRNVVGLRRNGEMRSLAVASTAYRVPVGAMSGKIGAVVTFNDVTEVLRLRGAEKALEQQLASEHSKLQDAYLKLEDAARQQAVTSRRIGLIRMVVIVLVFIAIAGVGLYSWMSIRPDFFVARDTAPDPGADTFTVSSQPISSRVAVVGSVDAGSVVSVVGPFDGHVKERKFEYGGPVERDRPIVIVDVSDLQLRLRDAEGTRIKARQRLDELRIWESGVDVSRARRTVATAELDNSNLNTRIAQTKLLLSKGIVPADEYNQLLQQQHSVRSQIESAKQDLATTLARGNAENVKIGEYELLNAQAKVDELQNDLARATVLAPVSGVVLQPPEIDGKRPDTLAVGSRVVRGQAMFAIGDLEYFSIRARVDEIDINKVRVGQTAIVTGDAFEDMSLEGKVATVAAQASGESTARAGMATFPVTVQISNLTPEQRARIHVGMSATVSIVAYENPDALVVPPSAVKDEGGKRFVTLRRGEQSETVPVSIGISTPDGIEIRQGLKAGDVIQLRP